MKPGYGLREITLAVGLLLGLSACAAKHRVENARGVADAGIAFSDSLPAVLDESFVLAVTADSLVLAAARGDIDVAERGQRLAASDKLLEERLTILRDLQEHALLLRSYFIALKSVAQADAATGITDATKGLFTRMSEIRPAIANATIGGATVSDLVGPVVELAVAAYQNRALRYELEQRGQVIERELELQRAALSAIGEQMVADKDLAIQVTERNPLVVDYVESGSLPASWSDRRISAFRRTIELESLDAATTAATNLRQTWIAFVENRLDETSVLLLLRDVNELVDLAGTIKAGS